MRWLKRWLFPYYLRFVMDLASRISAALLGAVDTTARGWQQTEPDPIRTAGWYPLLAQAVFAAETSKKPGPQKREAVVKVMHDWFAKHHLQSPPLKTLHLAIELALAGPLQRS